MIHLIRIISLSENVYVPSGRTIHWVASQNELIYLESFHTLQLSRHSYHTIVGPGDCLLAQNVTLRNSINTSARLRVIRLQMDHPQRDCIVPSLNSPIDPRLIKINRYLRSHCEEALTLHQLADLIGCNPVYLSNMYARVFQISPMKYLQKLKMEWAMKLLSTTDLSIKDVSHRPGYQSASQFADLFRRYHAYSYCNYKHA